jgi:Glycosyl transferase family 2
MSDSRKLRMSVVLSTPDRFETIRRTIACLRAQTVADQLEVVIVAPSADELDLDPAEMGAFGAFRVLEVGTIRSFGWAGAAGVRSASAPLVVFGEDHAFPDPGWAEALIAAHQGPWAAVGPLVRNANPRTSISRADFVIAYGPWCNPRPAGALNHLPGHNSSYKRAILLEYGPELDGMLEAESVLHWDMRRRGLQLRLEPAARLAHVNFAKLSPWMSIQFQMGRVFAATRATRWSLLRRLGYAGGSPLIPLVRFWRILQGPQQRAQGLTPATLPVLLFGLVISGAGEMIGYAFGRGDSLTKLIAFEFHRVRHITERDRQDIASRYPIDASLDSAPPIPDHLPSAIRVGGAGESLTRT